MLAVVREGGPTAGADVVPLGPAGRPSTAGGDDPDVADVLVRDGGAVGRPCGVTFLPDSVGLRGERLRPAEVGELCHPHEIAAIGAGAHERDALPVGRYRRIDPGEEP